MRRAATGAKISFFTGECYELFMGALGAANAQEALGQNATF
jgi:hypothetical protein